MITYVKLLSRSGYISPTDTLEGTTREGKCRKDYCPPRAEKNGTDLDSESSPGITATTTRSGQKVKKPIKICRVNHLESSVSKEGGVVGCR